jgi:hypothetical protein
MQLPVNRSPGPLHDHLHLSAALPLPFFPNQRFPPHRSQGPHGQHRPSPQSKARSASGDHSAVEPPVPIPNTEVKRRSANGSRTTGPARVGRCQINSPHSAMNAGCPRFTTCPHSGTAVTAQSPNPRSLPRRPAPHATRRAKNRARKIFLIGTCRGTDHSAACFKSKPWPLFLPPLF